MPPNSGCQIQAVNTNKIVDDQHHNLLKVLAKYNNKFDGYPGVYPHEKVYIYLFPG